MLARHNGGFGELFKQIDSAVRIVDIVVGKFLAVQLLSLGKAARDGERLLVENSLLTGIFAVTHGLRHIERERKLFGEFYTLLLAQIVCDKCVVVCGVLVYLIHKIEFCFFGNAAAGKFVKHFCIVRGIDQNSHVLIVLRGAAEHGGTADVYIFDGFLQLNARLGYSLFERIKIYHHYIYGVYIHLFEKRHMFGI